MWLPFEQRWLATGKAFVLIKNQLKCEGKRKIVIGHHSTDTDSNLYEVEVVAGQSSQREATQTTSCNQICRISNIFSRCKRSRHVAASFAMHFKRIWSCSIAFKVHAPCLSYQVNHKGECHVMMILHSKGKGHGRGGLNTMKLCKDLWIPLSLHRNCRVPWITNTLLSYMATLLHCMCFSWSRLGWNTCASCYPLVHRYFYLR